MMNKKNYNKKTSFKWKLFSKKQLKVMTWWCSNSPVKDKDGIIADGAVRSGKTISMAPSFINWAMESFNECDFALCGKTVGSLRRNVINTLKQQLLSLGFDFEEKRTENLIVISNGNVTNYFYTFGGKDESSQDLIQGMTLAGVLFDEVALMPQSFVAQAEARCSVEGAKLWYNCNPKGPVHYFKTDYIDKLDEKNLIYLHFNMDDNLTLSGKVKERYKRLFSGVFYQRNILGLWAAAEGLVYPMFDDSKHIFKFNGNISPRHRYYVSIDYGTVNPFACGLWDYDPGEQKAHMIRELYYNGGASKRVDDEEYYKMIKQLIGNIPIQYIVIDPSAASFIATVQKHSEYLVVKANNDVLNGIQTVTKYLNAGVLDFDESCRETFNEFKAYRWDEKSTEDRVIKETDHSMDQIRYFCYTVLKNELLFII